MEQPSDLKNNNNFKLSIQVRLNGLSFCILDSEKNLILWYHDLPFQKHYHPTKILEQIEVLYKTEKQLQLPVREVVILFSHDLYSFVPQEFFLEEEVSNLLKFSTKILKTDVVAHDLLEENDLVNVYIPYTNITNFFFEKYGEFEYKHSCSVLAGEALRDSNFTGPRAYLNNYKGYYDLVVVKESKLLLCNTFTYETREDFIYYLLFTAEQLQLDPENLELILLGEINEESPYYEIAYDYIKNVDFLNPEFRFKDEAYNKKEIQRKAFILLKSLGCE